MSSEKSTNRSALVHNLLYELDSLEMCLTHGANADYHVLGLIRAAKNVLKPIHEEYTGEQSSEKEVPSQMALDLDTRAEEAISEAREILASVMDAEQKSVADKSDQKI